MVEEQGALGGRIVPVVALEAALSAELQFRRDAVEQYLGHKVAFILKVGEVGHVLLDDARQRPATAQF